MVRTTRRCAPGSRCSERTSSPNDPASGRPGTATAASPSRPPNASSEPWRALGLEDDHIVNLPGGETIYNLRLIHYPRSGTAVWTNDRWVSNPHRVLNPPDTDCYSMPLFVTPPFHAVISCLPSCLADGEAPRYEPQQAGPYLLSRFDATHSYRNPLLAKLQ